MLSPVAMLAAAAAAAAACATQEYKRTCPDTRICISQRTDTSACALGGFICGEEERASPLCQGGSAGGASGASGEHTGMPENSATVCGREREAATTHTEAGARGEDTHAHTHHRHTYTHTQKKKKETYKKRNTVKCVCVCVWTATKTMTMENEDKLKLIASVTRAVRGAEDAIARDVYRVVMDTIRQHAASGSAENDDNNNNSCRENKNEEEKGETEREEMKKEIEKWRTLALANEKKAQKFETKLRKLQAKLDARDDSRREPECDVMTIIDNLNDCCNDESVSVIDQCHRDTIKDMNKENVPQESDTLHNPTASAEECARNGNTSEKRRSGDKQTTTSYTFTLDNNNNNNILKPDPLDEICTLEQFHHITGLKYDDGGYHLPSEYIRLKFLAFAGDCDLKFENEYHKVLRTLSVSSLKHKLLIDLGFYHKSKKQSVEYELDIFHKHKKLTESSQVHENCLSEGDELYCRLIKKKKSLKKRDRESASDQLTQEGSRQQQWRKFPKCSNSSKKKKGRHVRGQDDCVADPKVETNRPLKKSSGIRLTPPDRWHLKTGM